MSAATEAIMEKIAQRVKEAYCWGYLDALDKRRTSSASFEVRQAEAEGEWERASFHLLGPLPVPSESLE